MADDGADEDVVAQPPAIVASALAMSGPWGSVYGPVDLGVGCGGLTVLLGRAGQGSAMPFFLPLALFIGTLIIAWCWRPTGPP